MSGEWKARRFWKTVSVAAAEGGAGYAVMLDSRPVKTPGKAPLVVPSRPLAEALAAEWDAQEDVIRPENMSLTRAANTAIDGVAGRRESVVDEIAGYGASDLLCYRAPAPEALRARQARAWDPLLDWAARDLGAPLLRADGVMPCPQPEASLKALRREVARFTPFGLVGLHGLVALSGSLVIGLAAAFGRDKPETLWQLSRIDEEWQIELWGEDAEAAAHAAARRAGFLDAARLLSLLGVAARRDH